jgi:acyl-CoA dehydrogenase
MKNTATQKVSLEARWLDVARTLGAQFAERADDHDRKRLFVQQNYADLQNHRFFSAAIPEQLGGGGLSHQALCSVVRILSRYCGSTGLAYAMHSHPVAANVFKYLHDDEKAKATLSKIADNNLIIAGSGANDWLDSNGSATQVDGGYRVNAHKRFVSGGPAAQILVTSIAYDGENGKEVLHCAIPFSSEGISILDNWNTIGMRGTGSNDVILRDVFVPDTAIVARRPAGVWHPLLDTVIPIATPIIASCYVGIAEAAVELAINAFSGEAHLALHVGEMKNELVTAHLALDDMMRINNNYLFIPGIENTDAILARKAIATRAVKAAVEKAADMIGGPGFFQGHPIERMLRDVRAMHFHPLPEKRQQLFSGRLALKLDPVEHK